MKQLGVFFLLLVVATGVRAQAWMKLPSLPVTKHPAPYFINSDTGFIYSEVWVYGLWGTGYFESALPVNLEPGLWRTTDGGMSWVNVPTLESVNLTQVYFVSRTHGFATAIGSNGGIYATEDCGQTWTKLKPTGQFTGVYGVGSHVFASAIGFDGTFDDTARGVGPIWYSSDNGNSWDSFVGAPGLPAGGTGFQFVYGNRDSLVATVYPIPVSNQLGNSNYWLVYSTDLGGHWASSEISIMKSGMMTLFIPSHGCTIFRERNGGCSDPWRGFFSADYPYSNWNFIYQELSLYQGNSEISAWLAGNACVQYSNYTSTQSGFAPSMYRHDGAFVTSNWPPIADDSVRPNFQGMDFGDYRNVAVVGNGAIVYASDKNGNLWKTTDGGSVYFPLDTESLKPQLMFDHSAIQQPVQVTTCEPYTFATYSQSLGCSYLMLDSIWIDGLSHDEYTEAVQHHGSCLLVPDTATFVLSTKTAGQRTLAVHARFLDDDYNSIDTTLPLVLDVIQNANSVPVSLYLKPGSMTVRGLETISIPVYISAHAALSGSTTMTLPFTLDTNMLKVQSFDPAITGMSVGPIANSNGTAITPVQVNDVALNGETLIGTLRCVAYLADTASSSVSLGNASLTSENTPCVSLSLTRDSVNVLINGCGDETLLQFMKTGKVPLGIEGITPNPASGELRINLSNPSSSLVSYRVSDALGQMRLSGETQGNELSLDVSLLTQGVYFFRVSTGDGFAITRRIVIEH